MKADASTEIAVMKILEDLSNSFASRHLQRSLDLCATDADVILLGSEAGEKAIGRNELKNFLKRLFSRPMSYSLEWNWHSVSVESSVAWIVAEGLVHVRIANKHLSTPYHLTMVLVKRGGKWLIMHWHGSEPISSHK